MAGSGSCNGDTDVRTVDQRQDREQLHLVVIGAGLAGLAAAISTRLEAGHRVTVLEKVQKIEEIGAGLQVTPNATRLFQRWGVYDELAANAATPTYLAVRRYDGTRLLARDDKFQDKILDKYDSPFWDLHRTDVQIALVRRAESLGVEIRLGAEVVDIDSGNGTVTTAAGDVVQGDIIQGADGLWSRSRSLFLGRQVNPHPTGDIAYRIILHADDIQDQELKELVSKPSVNFWAGPKSHVVGYSIRSGRVYNLVLLTPDDLPEHVSRAAANVEEMRRLFEDWDPMCVYYGCRRSCGRPSPPIDSRKPADFHDCVA
jgi:salicylate hydroxylase